MEFDDHIIEVSSNLCHKFPRCSGDPTVFVGKDTSVVFFRHEGDNGLAIGTENDLGCFFED